MSSRLGPKTLRALDNELRAMRLRIAGQTFEQIAAALGMKSKASAWKAVQRARTARLVELAGLVQDLALADTERHLEALERQSLALLGKPLVARCRKVGTLLTQEAWERADQVRLHNVIELRPLRRRRASGKHGDEA